MCVSLNACPLCFCVSPPTHVISYRRLLWCRESECPHAKPQSQSGTDYTKMYFYTLHLSFIYILKIPLLGGLL